MAVSSSSRSVSARRGADLRALVFDFDGTLFETGGPWMREWQTAYARHGIHLSTCMWSNIPGTDTEMDPSRILYEHTGVRLSTRECRDVERATIAVLDRSQLRPGASRLISDAQETGILVALATNAKADWLYRWLPAALVPSFDVIVTRDDVTNGKPDSQLYGLVVQRLGIPPKCAVAFEDSAVGVAAARAAGMHCVFVTSECSSHYCIPDPEVMHVDSLESLTLRDLAQHIGAASTEHACVNAGASLELALPFSR